jgi:hypothetical protein
MERVSEQMFMAPGYVNFCAAKIEAAMKDDLYKREMHLRDTEYGTRMTWMRRINLF